MVHYLQQQHHLGDGELGAVAGLRDLHHHPHRSSQGQGLGEGQYLFYLIRDIYFLKDFKMTLIIYLTNQMLPVVAI